MNRHSSQLVKIHFQVYFLSTPPNPPKAITTTEGCGGGIQCNWTSGDGWQCDSQGLAACRGDSYIWLVCRCNQTTYLKLSCTVLHTWISS